MRRVEPNEPRQTSRESVTPYSSIENPRASAAERSAAPYVNGSTSQTDHAVISFVIPAFNEEKLIARTIESIHKSLRNQFLYEIIVVDNGSSDSTPEISRSQGARVISQFNGTIGSLRNTGARLARGDILTFLDADVVLTEDWAHRISSAVELLATKPESITGSLCDVPPNASWIERAWFAPRNGRYWSHIGTGHMIISRRFFDVLGGFDESLVTGEDYDLSRRARSQGASIVIDERLRVEHMDFPRTLPTFIKREMWHGTGDFRSVADVVSSKVAMIAIVVALLHGLALVGLLTAAPTMAVAASAAVVLLSVGSSIWKYRWEKPHVVALNSIIFYFYYVARGLSAVRLCVRAIIRR